MSGPKQEGTEILIVDDESNIRESLRAYLSHCGYLVCVCGDGESALEAFKEKTRPLVLTDLMMPGLTGDELLQEIKKIEETTEVVMMTGYGTIDSAVSAIKSGAYDYIVKPFRMDALLHVLEKAISHRNLVRENRRLQENSLNVLSAMVNVLEQRDAYTAGHSHRVTQIAVTIAGSLGLSAAEIKNLHLGGPIHDLGKIGIEDNILRKPGKLTREEYAVIKTHPEKGRQIIEPLHFLQDTIPLVMHHHEFYDGSGYPAGLRGEKIPLTARIITVADTFDAMTSSRAYRQARSSNEAFDELHRCRSTQFDPDIVDLFLNLGQSESFDFDRAEQDNPSVSIPSPDYS